MPIATRSHLRCRVVVRVSGLLLACALLASPVAGGGQDDVITNPAPERPAVPTRHERPLYCPRSAVDATLAVTGETPETLLAELAELHSTLQLEQALLVAERLVEIAPDRPLAYYNLACVLAKLHRIEPALAALDAAVDAGWRRVAQTVVDLDLDPIRRQPRFAGIIRRMGELAESERLQPAPLRDDPWLDVAAELEREAATIIERYHVPGVTMALVRDGVVVWTGAAGVTHRIDATPMTTDTRFVGFGPAHLVALAALVREDGAGLIPAGRLVQLARETQPPRAADATRPQLRLVREDAGGRWVTSDPPSQVSFVHRALVESLPLAIEVSTGTSYTRYCRENVLGPIGATSTMVDDPRADVTTAHGHTPLGTPVLPSPGGDGSVSTTAADAARVVGRLLAAEQGPRPASRVVRHVSSADVPYAGSPRPITVSDVSGGSRVELAGEDLGCGWLIRWHPESGCGFVVLYNAEGGAAAARHLAHLALGGEG